MKKFLPGIYLFVFVFSISVAIQVGTSSLRAGVKEKEKEEFIEDKVANLELETIQKKKIKVSDTSNQVTILNFWASWCLPCMEEMPSLVKLKSEFKDIKIVSINTDENNQMQNIQKTIKKFSITNEFEIVADLNTKISDSVKISSIPVTIVLKNKKILKRFDGPVDFTSGEFTSMMKNWLK